MRHRCSPQATGTLTAQMSFLAPCGGSEPLALCNPGLGGWELAVTIMPIFLIGVRRPKTSLRSQQRKKDITLQSPLPV